MNKIKYHKIQELKQINSLAIELSGPGGVNGLKYFMILANDITVDALDTKPQSQSLVLC